MTTRNRIILTIGLLLIPVLFRTLFYYQGIYSNPGLQTPNFADKIVPQPPTPAANATAVFEPVRGKVVLIDKFHDNLFDPSEIEPLVTAFSARGARVEYQTDEQSLALSLKYASAYLVFSPAKAYNVEDLLAVQQFIASGGRLLVFSDPTRALLSYDMFGSPTNLPDVNYSNPLIAPSGLVFVNDYLYNLEENEGNFRNVKFTQFADNPLTQGLQMVVFYGAHSVRAENGTALTVGSSKTFSSLTDQGGSLTTLALSANQQVLAAGDFSFMTNPYNQVADNTRLLGQIANFALSGERQPTLANFPYLFQRPVSLVPSGELYLTSEALGPVANLQKILNAVNLPLNPRLEPKADEDLILLGTFDSGKSLQPYLRPFKLDLTKVGETLTIPEIGKISSEGNGLLLFTHTAKTNTLILLAPQSADLPGFIDQVASGNLSGCVLTGQVGVCKLTPVDESGSSSSETATPEAESTPSESATPTPAG
jgi:hypothetical protein